MRAYQEILEAGREEGFLQGALKAKLEIVSLLRELELSDEVKVIAARLNLPLEKVKAT